MQTLVLARASTSSAPMTVAALARDLERFAPEPGAGWRQEVERAVGELIAQGTMDEARKVIDGAALGQQLGTRAEYRWARLTDWALPALALGLSAGPEHRKKLGDRDSWAAAIVARALGLWRHGPPPSLPALCDELAWQRLGLAGKAKRLPEEVRALFLQRELATSPAPASRLLRLLAARELGVTSTELRALRNALVRRWLEHGPLQGKSDAPVASNAIEAAIRAAPMEPHDATAASSDDDAEDDDATASPAPLAGAPAALALAAATAAAEVPAAGRFGDRKVFISAAWQQLIRHPAWRGLSLADFKAGLLTALRDSAVVLARADLVGAMDPELVELSETESAAGATFHFIVVEGT